MHPLTYNESQAEAERPNIDEPVTPRRPMGYTLRTRAERIEREGTLRRESQPGSEKAWPVAVKPLKPTLRARTPPETEWDRRAHGARPQPGFTGSRIPQPAEKPMATVANHVVTRDRTFH